MAAEDQSGKEGQDVVAGLRGARTGDDLEPARQEDDRGKEPKGRQERAGYGDGEDPHPEQAQGHDRLLGTGFHDQEQGPERQPHQDQAADPRARPVGGLLVRQANEEWGDGRRENSRSQVVDVAGGVGALDGRQQTPQDDQRDGSDGDIHEEDPVPADVVRDQAADGRSNQ